MATFTDCPPVLSFSEGKACILHALRSHWLKPRNMPLFRCRSWPRCSALSVGAQLMSHSNVPGLWLEFGAFSGASARWLAGIHSPIYSFDSFRGLPEQWREPDLAVIHEQTRAAGGGRRWFLNERQKAMNISRDFLSRGSFDKGGRPPFMDRRIRWQIGLFNETLPRFLTTSLRGSSNVSFVHIDCDIYSSAALVLQLLEQRLSPGAVLVFDELINYNPLAELI
jgi:hypothetical protein